MKLEQTLNINSFYRV